MTHERRLLSRTLPGNPIMPGVLQLEALAQCSAPVLLSLPQNKGKLALYAGVDGVKI